MSRKDSSNEDRYIVGSDVDTANTVTVGMTTPNCYGRQNIYINSSVEQFRLDPINIIKTNIGDILSKHNKNVVEMEYLQNYVKGKCDILNKVRANGDTKINNKHVTNYAWEFVKFKQGYYVGKPIKYVDLMEEKSNDITYFNRYIKDVNKASKDLIKYENMLITGIAYTMVVPQKQSVDIEYESPYIYEVLDNKDVCVVRSNDIFKSKLFTMCISEILNHNGRSYNEYTIYYDNIYLVFNDLSGNLELVKQGIMPVYNCITEYQLNSQRMGVFEVVLNSLNSLNKMTSNQLDLQEETINNYLVFENVEIDDITAKSQEFKQNRTIAINTNNPEKPAKVYSITMKDANGETSINDKYLEMEQRAYDIVGVPKPTSSTGQGVSGEAQVYGGGWENAQIIALLDTNYITQFELEDLKKFLSISNSFANSKTTNLISTNIDIKYTINKSNNMMVKAQSLKYFLEEGFTMEQALTFCEITDDPQHEGNVAEQNREKLTKEQFDREMQLKNSSSVNTKETDI